MEIIKQKFLGIWELKEFSMTSNDNKIYPFGKNPIGRIMYFENNHMAAYGLKPDPQLQNSPVIWPPCAGTLDCEQAQLIIESFFGYFAKFEINLEKQQVQHHVEGHYIQGYIGQTFVRDYQFYDDKLRLYYNENNILNELIWKKMAEGI